MIVLILILLDQAMIYFGLSLLFSPSESDEREDESSILESLFEMVYRVLDPYLAPLPFQATSDIIDALICLYIYNLDNLLLAIAMAIQSGVDPLTIAQIVPLLQGAPGRLEQVVNTKNIARY